MDKRLHQLVLIGLVTFALVSAVLIFGHAIGGGIYVAALVWGATFDGAATLLQTASADTAGADADLAQSMIVTVWNAAIAGGGIVGGGLLLMFGAASFAPAVLVLPAIACMIVHFAREHGFTRGVRSAA